MKSSSAGSLGACEPGPVPGRFPLGSEDLCFMFLAGDSRFARLRVERIMPGARLLGLFYT